MAEENKVPQDDLDAILSEINETIRQEKISSGSALSSDYREMLDRMTEEQTSERTHAPHSESAPEPKAPQKPQRGRPPKKKTAEPNKAAETPESVPNQPEEVPAPEKPKPDKPKAGKKTAKAPAEEKTPEPTPEESVPEKPAEEPAPELKVPVPEKVPAEPHTERRVRRAPSRTGKVGSAILGAFVLLFVVIGLVATVRQVWKLSADAINQTKLKEELAVVVFPLVIVDVPEFTDPANLDSSVIMSSSIWKFIIDKTDKSTYRRNDMGIIEIPNVDIEREVRRLFGSNVEIVHQSMDNGIIQMSYSQTSNYYYVETVPHSLPYTPRVDEIVRDGDIYTLRVSYLLPDVLWNLEDIKEIQAPDKVMEYRLQKVDGDYQVLSVKLLEVNSQATEPLPEEDMNFDMEDVPISSEETSSDTTEQEGTDTASSDTSN